MYPGEDVTPFSRCRKTGKEGPSLTALLLSFIPADACFVFNQEIAVVAEADPSTSAGGVGTLDLVLPSHTFLAQVATEMSLEARPVGH